MSLVTFQSDNIDASKRLEMVFRAYHMTPGEKLKEKKTLMKQQQLYL